jgi:catalase
MDRPTALIESDSFEEVVEALDSNFGAEPGRRAAHAKGIVTYGTFTATSEARSICKAGHLQGEAIPVVARFSNFPGGASHPDAAPESNPRGFAVQFRLPDGRTTDLLAHSIDGFPGRTVEDFSGFLRAISPDGPGPEAYLSEHPAAAAFVQAIQVHGTPESYCALTYFAVNAFVFAAEDGTVRTGRYTWEPADGNHYIPAVDPENLGFNFLAEELERRLSEGDATFHLVLSLAEAGDATDDANAHWPRERQTVTLGTLTLRSVAADSELAGRGLFFDPVRLVDGIGLSDDPLLVGRTRTYPLSLARRHSDP